MIAALPRIYPGDYSWPLELLLYTYPPSADPVTHSLVGYYTHRDMADSAPVPVALRKKVLKVLFISLLLDLVHDFPATLRVRS